MDEWVGGRPADGWMDRWTHFGWHERRLYRVRYPTIPSPPSKTPWPSALPRWPWSAPEGRKNPSRPAPQFSPIPRQYQVARASQKPHLIGLRVVAWWRECGTHRLFDPRRQPCVLCCGGHRVRRGREVVKRVQHHEVQPKRKWIMSKTDIVEFKCLTRHYIDVPQTIVRFETRRWSDQFWFHCAYDFAFRTLQPRPWAEHARRPQTPLTPTAVTTKRAISPRSRSLPGGSGKKGGICLVLFCFFFSCVLWGWSWNSETLIVFVAGWTCCRFKAARGTLVCVRDRIDTDVSESCLFDGDWYFHEHKIN